MSRNWTYAFVLSLLIFLLPSLHAQGPRWYHKVGGVLEDAHFRGPDFGWTAEDGGRIRFWDHLLQAWGYGETPDDARDPLRGVFFLDELQPLHGWAVGEEGTILKSTDGGATWSRANPTPILNRNTQPTPAHLNTIFMHDASNGWVGGDDGAFYRTDDGWATWSFPSGCTLPPGSTAARTHKTSTRSSSTTR